VTAAPVGTDLAAAAAAIQAGGVVAYPTDTVVGLGCDARNPAAVARLLAIKGRDDEKGLPVLIAAIEDAADLAEVTPDLLRLAEEFWPGALTIVTAALPGQPGGLMAADGTIGLRVPDLVLTRRLIERFDGPIVGTSANRSGEPPARSAGAIEPTLAAAIDYILDGESGGEAPSTVITLATRPPRLLRPGPVDLSDLRQIVPDLTDR
jgi:L-threonylcarbamoyladenylate synthase